LGVRVWEIGGYAGACAAATAQCPGVCEQTALMMETRAAAAASVGATQPPIEGIAAAAVIIVVIIIIIIIIIIITTSRCRRRVQGGACMDGGKPQGSWGLFETRSDRVRSSCVPRFGCPNQVSSRWQFSQLFMTTLRCPWFALSRGQGIVGGCTARRTFVLRVLWLQEKGKREAGDSRRWLRQLLPTRAAATQTEDIPLLRWGGSGEWTGRTDGRGGSGAPWRHWRRSSDLKLIAVVVCSARCTRRTPYYVCMYSAPAA
jgi:hypothetical protein